MRTSYNQIQNRIEGFQCIWHQGFNYLWQERMTVLLKLHPIMQNKTTLDIAIIWSHFSFVAASVHANMSYCIIYREKQNPAFHARFRRLSVLLLQCCEWAFELWNPEAWAPQTGSFCVSVGNSLLLFFSFFSCTTEIQITPSSPGILWTSL